MRRNLLRERLASDDVLVGVVPPFVSAEAVEFFGLLGFDWIFLDGEHGPIGVETCYSLVRAADAVGLATVVRAPANEPWLALSYAESGANAILVPHIATAADGDRLARSLHYPPDGNRGAMSGSRAANYGITQTPADYFAATDRHALPIAMIEDVEALDNLEEIVSVPGIDTFLIGPGDLAMSMGMPGGADRTEVRDAANNATRSLTAAGKIVGTVVADVDTAATAIEAGTRLVGFGIGGTISRSMRELVTAVRAIV